MIENNNAVVTVKNNQNRSVRWAQGVFAVLLSSGLMACGGARVQQYPDFVPVASSARSLPLPESLSSLRARVTESPNDASDALVLAYLRDLYGDTDGALAALTAEGLVFDDPLLASARGVAVLGLRDRAPQFDAYVGAWLSREGLVGVHPYETWVRHELRHLLALREGIQNDRASRVASASLGHPERWNSYGPVSALDSLPFEESPHGLKVASLRELPTDSVRQFAERVSNASRVDTASGAGGTFLFESFVRVDSALDALLVVQSAGNYRVWIGGVEVDRRGPADVWSSSQHARPVALHPGVHRVLVQVGARISPDFSFRLVPLNGTIASFDNEVVPTRKGEVQVSDLASANPLRWFMPPLGDVDTHPAAWIAQALLAEFTADSAEIERLLAELSETSNPTLRWLAARLSLADGAYSPGVRKNRAMAIVRTMDPSWRPLSGVDEIVVELLAGASQHSAALDWLRAVPNPNASPVLQLQEAEVLSALGFSSVSEQRLRELWARYPFWCPSLDRLVVRWVARGYPVRAEDVAASEGRCPEVRSQLAWTQAAPQAQWDALLSHTSAALARNPSRLSLYRTHLRAMIIAQRLDAIESTLDAARRYGMADGEVAQFRAMAAQVNGDRPAIEAALRARLASEPWEIDWQHQISFLDGARALDDLRVDGMAVARDYFASDARRTGEIVYVLDYSAWRYFETTGSVGVVHQIIQVNSRDAIAERGEVAIPRGNALLTLRVITPDGRVHVPESIAGKDSISLPNLAVGDLIEMEFLTSARPVSRDEDFHDTGMFYFASDAGEMLRSEVVIEYPASWASSAELELRNFEGEHTVERFSGRVRERAVVFNSPQFFAEPGMPGADYVFPTARFSVDAALSKLVRAYGNRILPSITTDAMVGTAARALVSEHSSDRDRIHAIFRYVNDEIIDVNGFFSVNALQTIHAQQGDRYALLVSMLRAAGYDPQVVFIESFGDDSRAFRLPSMAHYSTVAIRVKTRREEFWMMASGQHTPFQWILPENQGQRGLVVFGPQAGETLVTPKMEAKEESRLTAKIQLRADGSAMIDVVERLSTEASAYMREDLENLPSQDERVRDLEYELAPQFPGVEVRALTFLDEGADTPLVRRYQIEVASLATTSDAGLVFDRAFFIPARVWYYAGLERRRLPLISTYSIDETLEVRLELPPGYRVVTAPPSTRSSWRAITHSRETAIEDDGQVIRWTRRLRVPMVNIAPEDYAQYAGYMRDLAVQERIRVLVAEP